MATTMKLIGKQTLGADAASVTFSSIPGSPYTDLYLVMTVRTDRAANYSDGVKVQFNAAGNDNNMSYRELYGDSTTAASLSSTSAGRLGFATAASNTASTFSSSEAYIPNYAGSANKSWSTSGVMENNSSTQNQAFVFVGAGLWSQTAAITEIKLLPQFGTNFKSDSSFYLYGLTKS